MLRLSKNYTRADAIEARDWELVDESVSRRNGFTVPIYASDNLIAVLDWMADTNLDRNNILSLALAESVRSQKEST